MEPDVVKTPVLTTYTFKKNNVTVSYLLTPDSTTDIELGVFANKSDVKGAGKQLFCESLLWIQKNLPFMKTVSVASVPYTNVYKKLGISKQNAQTKLNKYYQSLGFSTYGNESEHTFIAPIETLINHCKVSGGGKTRKQKRNQPKRLYNFLAEANERERLQRERQLAESEGIPEVTRYPPRFLNIYGNPINVSSPEDIEWRQRWNARLYPNDPRHIRGTPMNQRRRLVEHREQFFPALQNIQKIGRSRRQQNKLRKMRANLVEELKYLPPIPELGFPGGNIYRQAEEEWKTFV